MKKSIFLKHLTAIAIVGLLSPKVSFGQNIEWALKHTISDYPFYEGLAKYYDTKNCKYGMINSSGEIVIQPQFNNIGNFAGGMAWVETATGNGIINRKGAYLLYPNYDYVRNYERLMGRVKYPELFEIVKGNKHGLFYNGSIILPVEYNFVNIFWTPFVEYGNIERTKVINLTTGEIFDKFNRQGSMQICEKDGVRYYYDLLSGEQIDSTLYQTSSKGVVAFRDERTKLFGFKNMKTGQIITNPRFQKLRNSIWISDMMIAVDSINKNIPQKETLIDCDGKPHQLGTSGNESLWIMGDYILLSLKKGDSLYYALFDKFGKNLIPLSKESITLVEDGWLNVGNVRKTKRVYDAINNVYYPGYVLGVKDNMLAVTNDTCSYFIDATTRKKIKGEYRYIEDFSEGLARVNLSKDPYDVAFIDKKGNIRLKGDKELQFKESFSEGVIGVYNHKGVSVPFDGYIYNPLGHGAYSYKASDKMAVDGFVVNEWNEKGHKAFANKQYGIAKDYYYRVMMNDPSNVDAIINYGAALGNLGYYDEAIESCRIALDIDPDNQLAKDNLRINIDNKQKEEARLQAKEEEEREARATKSSTFWDALGNFANILSSVAGGTSVYQPYSSFSMDMDYSPSSSTTGSNHDYQSEYNRWANLAERHYNSLTNLGYRVKHNDNSRSGGTLSSMSGSKYVQMKKSLRDAQHEMQRIRRKASQNGVAITPSTWETATVGY